MKQLRKRFERFCFRHRDWGIPNLMLYIVLGCGVVSILGLLGYNQIYSLLCFDRQAILRGQVWRLISYVFTMNGGGILTTLLLLYCYYSLGRAVELSWGTLRFNLYYLTGILLMDIYAMVCGGAEILDTTTNTVYTSQFFSGYYANYMTTSLHLSMLICYATLYSESQFLLFFLIPIKAWILALIYLAVVIFQVVSMTVPISMFPHNLFPLVALANYFLFFGKDVANILPFSWRLKLGRRPRKAAAKQTGTVDFDPVPPRKTAAPKFTHRCSVCGKTDVSDPGLEFRYCSRCNGYFCYCEDHINNHTHVE